MEIKKIIKALVDNAEMNGYDVDLSTDYSGRGMYGKTCYGVTCDSFGEFLRDVAEIVSDTFDPDDYPTKTMAVMEFVELLAEVNDFLLDYRTDSMGRSSIFYWPNIEGDVE